MNEDMQNVSRVTTLSGGGFVTECICEFQEFQSLQNQLFQAGRASDYKTTRFRAYGLRVILKKKTE